MTEFATPTPIEVFQAQQPPAETIGVSGIHINSVNGISLEPAIDEDGFNIIQMSPEQAYATLVSVKQLAETITGDPSLVFMFDAWQDDSGNGRFLEHVARWGLADSATVQAMGTSVEFAGPTDRQADSNILPGFKPDIVTNIVDAHLNADETVDAYASVRDMPFAAESIGSVHISALGSHISKNEDSNELRRAAVDESCRVLKEGGFFVYDAASLADHTYMVQKGLVPRALNIRYYVHENASKNYAAPLLIIDGIYQKQVQSQGGEDQV